MCHGKEMPTDYESKRNGPDYTLAETQSDSIAPKNRIMQEI